jgi:hypothetical protein
MASASDPLLSNRCRLPHRTLWWGRALLYEDRVCVTGWTWRGRYRRVIPLDRIEGVKWWAVPYDVNFLIRLDGGGGVPLRLVKGAGTWNARLRNLLGEEILAQQALSDVHQTASPAS